jgi:GAF domain-containing protein
VTAAGDQLELRRLQALHKSGLRNAPSLREPDDLCERARTYFGVEAVLVTLIDASLQIIKSAAGTEIRETSRDVAFCNHTIRSDDLLVVSDTTQDPRFASNPFVVGPPFIRFYAGAPLIYVDGARLGSFCLLDSRPRSLSPLAEVDLTLTAEQVVGALLEHDYETKFQRSVA